MYSWCTQDARSTRSFGLSLPPSQEKTRLERKVKQLADFMAKFEGNAIGKSPLGSESSFYYYDGDGEEFDYLGRKQEREIKQRMDELQEGLKWQLAEAETQVSHNFNDIHTLRRPKRKIHEIQNIMLKSNKHIN